MRIFAIFAISLLVDGPDAESPALTPSTTTTPLAATVHDPTPHWSSALNRGTNVHRSQTTEETGAIAGIERDRSIEILDRINSENLVYLLDAGQLTGAP